jgi:hypothetical protein
MFEVPVRPGDGDGRGEGEGGDGCDLEMEMEGKRERVEGCGNSEPWNGETEMEAADTIKV